MIRISRRYNETKENVGEWIWRLRSFSCRLFEYIMYKIVVNLKKFEVHYTNQLISMQRVH